MTKTSAAVELHHAVPRFLLRMHDAAFKPRAGEDLWVEYEHELTRYGVSVTVTREDLSAMIEASTVLVSRDEHRNGHESDFVRWGRRGGLRTLELYGSAWFALLARRRWDQVSPEALEEALGRLVREEVAA
jgi:hypothetical protein